MLDRFVRGCTPRTWGSGLAQFNHVENPREGNSTTSLGPLQVLLKIILRMALHIKRGKQALATQSRMAPPHTDCRMYIPGRG